MVKISLTNHQTSIWLEAQIQKGTPIFNIGTFVELNGVPNKALLEKAIKEVIAQNDALRIRVAQSALSAKQKFLRDVDFNLDIKSFKGGNQSREEALKWMHEEFIIPMKLDRQKLYQITLVVVDDNSSFLFFKHHHIYIDGWSRALLVRKISDQYNAIISGVPKTAESSFSKYVQENVSNPKDEKWFESVKFWQDQFGDYERTALLEKKNKLKSNLPSRRRQMILEREVFDAVNLSGFTGDKAKFYFFIATLYITLSRERGQREIVFGVPLLNRFNETEKNTLGYFVGLLPLKLCFSADISFRDLVAGIRLEMAKNVPHRDLAIHEINKAVGVNFTNSTQLYDVVFSFEVHNHEASFGNIDVVEAGTFSSDYEQNPLVIHVQDYIKKGAVNFEFDYNLNHLTGTEVESLIRRYKNVIDTFISSSDVKIESATVLFPSEIDILHDYSSNSIQSINPLSLVDQILESCEKTPEKILVQDENGTLTYNELLIEAQNLASHIIDLGIEKGEAIGVMVPRYKESVIAILGVMMSGACYVPIDPALSDDRILGMLQDSGTKKIVCHKAFTKAIVFDQYKLIHPGSIVSANRPQFPSLDSSSLAYIIFTSGSTGRPKGVMVNHGNVSNLIQALNTEVYSNYPEDTVLALLSSFNFDASIQQLFASLILGRELVIVPSTVRQDGKLLAEFLVENNIGICDGIPTHLLSMVTRTENFNNKKLKHLIIGGESFSIELAERFYNWIGNTEVKVSNVYGPTECTVDATVHTFDGNSFKIEREIPIGHPIANNTIWILDENDQLVPPGIQGEICIGGAGVSPGYVNDEKLTYDKFRLHTVLNKVLYHTGDIGKWNDKGLLTFIGRKDGQVKIRGYRIELGEIEYWMSKIDGVEQAIVLVQETESQKRLIGFLQSKSDFDEEKVKNVLSQELPGYMIPHFINAVEKFPLTHTGKIDRNELLNFGARNNGTEINLPITSTERSLAEIFAEVLEIKQVDVKGGFFSLGGDSMSLMFLLVKIEEEFGVSISMSDFGSMNSVRAVSNYLDSSGEIQRVPVLIEDEIYDLSKLKTDNNSSLTIGRTRAFITGASGFIGAYLTEKVCKEFEQIICLIRAESIDAAKIKLTTAFKKYNLDAPNWNKINIVIGDLSKDRLGLSDADWQTLHDVDYIYHCGAEVNFVKDFQSLKKSNVLSTFKLLELCSIGKEKCFNFISTKGVFGEEPESYAEDDDLSSQIHYVNKGYESTKWVSDVMTKRARERGIQSNIFRLGRITGDSLNGYGRNEDFFHRFIEGCIEIKCFPLELLELSTDLTPVDLTVRAVIELSFDSTNSNYHLVNDKLTLFKGLVKACEKVGVNLEIATYDDWIQKVEKLNRVKEMNPFYLITPILKQKEWFSVESAEFDGKNTAIKTEALGINWPEGDDLWPIYVQNCISRQLKVN